MTRGRRTVALAGALAVAALLAGCAATGPTPLEQAEAAFDDLVAQASALDGEVLRTVTVEPRAQEVCGPDTDRVSIGLSATATLPVTATGIVLDQVAADLVGSLDPEVWLPIEPSDGLDQQAVEHEDGTVVTVTVADRLLVIAVFTPCIPPEEG